MKELLDRALELNIFSEDQHLTYHVFGDGDEYCRNRKRLQEIVSLNQVSDKKDSVIFHDDLWNSDEELSESEKALTEIGWTLLDELAAHKEARGKR